MLLGPFFAGCAASTAEPQPMPPAVLGVTTDMAVASLEVRFEVAGAVVQSTLLEAPSFPLELHAPQAEAPITVLLRPHDDAGQPLYERRLRFVPAAGRTLLARVRLEALCVPDAEHPRPSSCPPSATCVAGLCADPYVATTALEDYRPDWAAPFADACTDGSSEPSVTLGRDGEPFVPLQAGDELVPEQGEQGGVHVWIAVRMRGVHADGAVTAVTGDVLETGLLGSVQQVRRAYEPGPDGCELQHVRYILPQNGAQDTTLRIGATVIDTTALAAHAHVDAYVSHP
jgi:hypothetical protein